MVFGNGRTHTGEVVRSGGSRLANYYLRTSQREWGCEGEMLPKKWCHRLRPERVIGGDAGWADVHIFPLHTTVSKLPMLRSWLPWLTPVNIKCTFFIAWVLQYAAFVLNRQDFYSNIFMFTKSNECLKHSVVVQRLCETACVVSRGKRRAWPCIWVRGCSCRWREDCWIKSSLSSFA